MVILSFCLPDFLLIPFPSLECVASGKFPLAFDSEADVKESLVWTRFLFLFVAPGPDIIGLQHAEIDTVVFKLKNYANLQRDC